MRITTYHWQFWHYHPQQSQCVDSEIRQIIACVMRAGEEQTDGYTQQEFLGRSELVAVIHLLPHVEVVEGSRVEFEGDAPDPVEHQVRAEHVGEIREGPGSVALDTGYDAEKDLESNDEDYMDYPSPYETRHC